MQPATKISVFAAVGVLIVKKKATKMLGSANVCIVFLSDQSRIKRNLYLFKSLFLSNRRKNNWNICTPMNA
jgi:hypothetical protein